MNIKYFFVINGEILTLDEIMGVETGKFQMPVVGHTITFFSSNINATKYTNKDFKVISINYVISSDDCGNISQKYYIELFQV